MPISKNTLKALGPGFLFAAVSVGVSHLVQSTRAAAGYGFTLVWIILLAMLLKYPLFEFGQRYAAATGHSLLEGYRRQGKWSLVLYLLLTLGTMFTVLAAVTAVTAGLAIQLTGWEPVLFEISTITTWSAILIMMGVLILVIGRFPLMDKVIKATVIILTLSTIVATFTVLPKLGGIRLWGAVGWKDIGFIVALVGWMPTGLDVSVWQSFWTLAKKKETGYTATLTEALLDFNIGYIGTGILALMFCVLGTAVMFDKSIVVQESAGAFAGQIIDLYTSTLGEWSRPIIVIAAFTTIFSTMLTVIDGFPRALQLVGRRFRIAEEEAEVLEKSGHSWDYWTWLSVLSIGAMLIILFYVTSLGDLVDLATTLSFISAPFLGFLTYRAILSPEVPSDKKPGVWLHVLAVVGIIFLSGFMLFFLYFKFLG